MILLNIAGLARPVRIAAKSSFATETAFSIFSSASRSVSSITLRSRRLVLRSASVVRAGSSGSAVRETSVPIFSPRTARAMLPSVEQVEHDDRQLVVRTG